MQDKGHLKKQNKTKDGGILILGKAGIKREM